MSLTSDHHTYVTRMFRRVLNKDTLPMETQMNMAHMICDNDLSITNEIREQACLVLALVIENHQQVSSDVISFLNISASQQSNIYSSRLTKYILCVNGGSHPSYFLSGTIFENLDLLLEETSNVQMQNWVIWAYATRVKYGVLSNLEQTQMKLLKEYLSHSHLSWSVSYIIRKMTERSDEQISEEVWYHVADIISSDKYDVGTYNNALYTLSNLFSSKYTAQVSLACKQHVQNQIEHVIATESLSKDILSNAVRAVKSIVINGYKIREEIILKLKELALDDHPCLSENVKIVLDLLNDDTNKQHTIDISKQHNCHVRTEKIAVTKTVLIERSLGKIVEPQAKFIDLEMMMDTYGHGINCNQCGVNMEHQSHVLNRDDRLSFFRNTSREVRNLLKLATNGEHLVPAEINYLIEKFLDDAMHVSFSMKRNEIYKLIASTFQQSVINGQQPSDVVMQLLVHHLISDTSSSKLACICSDTLLEIVKRDQFIPDYILKQLADRLPEINDSVVRKTTLTILVISAEKGKNDMNVSLETLKNDLLQRTTSLLVSYLFLRAILTEKEKLSLEAFKNLCHVVVSPRDKVYHIDARRNCMKAIAYSIKMMEERESLLPRIQFCLIRAFEDTDDKIRSLALQTLCSYCKVECITHFHPCILNDYVYRILINEINTQSSKQLQNITSLYLQAALKKHPLLKKVLIGISDLLGVTPDFTVRQKAIWTLKYVSEGLNTIVLPPDVLTNIEIALDDPEFDIRIVAANVFLNNWEKSPIYFLKNSQTSITKLLTNKFDVNVQKFALTVLKRVVEQKHKLSNDLMELIAQFLFDPDMTIVNSIVDILFHYVKYHTLTQNIVRFVEQTFHNKQNQETIIEVLQKCAFNQCILTEKTLITLGDLLFDSIEEITINNIILTLESADRNQPLPDIINDLLKYEYYMKVLTNSECEKEVEYAEQQLIDATSNGKRLSKGILNSLQQLLSNGKRQTSTLKIIVNVTSNGQNLNNDMIDILSNFICETFSNNQVYLIIKIFLNIIVNNQTPPDTFLVHLQKFINDTTINTDVILIYTILLERNASSLSTNVIDLIYQLLENVNKLNLKLKQTLSTFVKLAIESGITPPKPELLTALLDEKDLLIRSNSIQMIYYMVKVSRCKLSDNVLTSLSQINMDKKVLEILETASRIQELPIYITDRLELVHCQNLHEDIDLLKKLKLAVSHGQLLLKHNFLELSNLLYSSKEEHRILASEILGIIATSNQTIPDQVIRAIATTLQDESIHFNTIKLLDKAVQCGSKVSDRTMTDLIDLATQPSTNIEVKEIARKILQNQNTIDFLIIEKYLCEIATIENEQIESLIEHNKTKIPMDILPLLYDQLTKQPSATTETKILKVLQCAIHNGQSLSDDLLYYISNGLTKNNHEIVTTILYKAMENGQILTDDIVYNIEKSFLFNATKSVLNLIRKLAKQYTLFQDDTIKFLIDKSENDEDTSSIIEIIAEYQQLPPNIILPYLNKNLSSDDISKVRSSFIILQYQVLKNYIEEPINLLTKVALRLEIDQNKLATEISSIDEYLNMVRSLLSIEYFDENILINYPVKQWSRECLCFDLLARIETKKKTTEIYAFYHNLSELEKSKGYELHDQVRDYILRFLIEKHAEMDINKINQTLFLLQDVSIDALNSNDLNWYENLIKCYIREKVIKHFPLSEYSQSITNHLFDILLDAYHIYQSVEVLISILESCTKPDQLITFLQRLFDHKVTNEELNEILLLSKKTEMTLDKQLDMKLITNKLFQIWQSPLDSLKQVDELLRKLSSHWSFSNLCSILDCMEKTSEALTNFIQYLTIINDYGIDDTLAEEIIHLFKNQSDICFSKIYKLIINHCFPVSNTVEKPIQQLIEEILENNRNNQSVLRLIRTNKLQEILLLNQSVSLRESLLIETTLPIDSWNSDDIKKWSTKAKLNKGWVNRWENLSEIIAVIQRAIYLDSNFKVRHIQLMAVLLLLDTNQRNRGRLAQIATGEGKSAIISILAIIKALQGLHVDIVTSSTTLAQRDAEGKAKLYDMFNLSVSHNVDDKTLYTSGPKECYKSSIVYGDISHFQFDILRDEFSLLNTRDKRPFDVVIIDEVDSMLIDENNKIARLADYILGMEYLNPILNAIWQAINNPAVQETIDKRAIIHNVKLLILNKNAQITVPQHLRSFVFSQLSIWINNALLARDIYKLDHHYMIKSDEKNINRITPIDYSNTGIIQSSTTWSDGLHQFLQLKHGLKLTPLNLTTNFLSNFGFFDRYEKNMYGLTGTLGSKEAKQLLCNVYSVDTIEVPKYKQICHIELPTIILDEEKQWIQTIVQNSLTEIRRNRSVLIICETRMNAKAIFKELRQQDFKGIVKLYTDNTDTTESNVADSRANSGDIIVATNLAGRGTDLKTSKEVEDNGGLHVCLTFMPINLRVKQQAFGRTSRQGNRGTSQLILNTDNVIPRLLSIYPKFIEEHPDLSTDDLQKSEYLRDWCEKAETAQLNETRIRDIPEIKSNDELFQKFCQLLAHLRQTLADLRQIDNDEYKLNSVKERWGLWLKDKDRRDKVKLSLLENVTMAGFRFLDENSGSFYHAVNQQLQEHITDEKLKIQMIEHIIQNQHCYEQFFKNIDNDTCILYVEETMMKALTRTININIVLFTSYEDSITVYKRRGAIQTIYLAGQIDHSYYSLGIIDKEKILDYISECEDEDDTPVKIMTIRNHFNVQLYKKLSRIFHQQNDLKEYVQFEKEIRDQFQEQDKIIQNPFYHIAKADMLIAKTQQFITRAKHVVKQVTSLGTMKSTERKEALECLNSAIQLDPVYSFTAYVNRAYLTIEQRSSTMSYKKSAKEDLIKARDQINNFILPGMHSMQLNLYKDKNDDRDYGELSKQLTIKIDIIQLYNSHIENAVLAIEHSQKLIDINIFDKHKITTITKLERHEALSLVSNYSKNTSGLPVKDNVNNRKYKLSFYNLLVHKDMGIKKDQGETLINLMKYEYHHISIQFQQITGTLAKDIIQSFEKIVHHANLRVDYLNKEELSELFYLMIPSKTMLDVIMTLKNRKQYEDVIQKSNTAITINISMEKTMKFSRSNEALDYLNQNTDQKILSISVASVNMEFFEAFISMSLDGAYFSLTFNKLSTTEISNVLKTVDKHIFIEFIDLNFDKALKILNTRAERDFLICLDNLEGREVQRILKEFDPNEQNVNVNLNRIDDKYVQNDKPDDELNDLDQHGINKLIIINELNSIPWFSVVTIAALGAAQIIGGVCLTAFTCGIGVTLGISLITEGVSDLYVALRGTMSRDINWKDYAIQKGVSLAICFVTLGLSVVSQSARAAQKVGTKASSQFVKQTWIQAKNLIRTSFQTIGQEAIENAARSSLGLACKQVAVTSAEIGARELLNYSADSILNNHLLADIKLEIGNYVESSMNEMVDEDPEYQAILEKVFFIDCYNQNHQWQNQIEQIATNIFNTSNEFIEAAKSFASGASNASVNHLQKIGGTTKNILKVAQTGLNIIETVQKAVKSTTLTKKFFYAFKNELQKQVKGMPDIIELLSKEQNIGREVAETIFLILKTHHIFNQDGLLNQHSFLMEDQNENIIEQVVTNEQITDHRFSVGKLEVAIQKIDLNIFGRDYKTIVKNFFVRILSDTYQMSILQKKIHTLLINHLMSVIQGILVEPFKKYIIGKAVNFVSQGIQRKLDKNNQTIVEKAQCAGAQRYINIATNEFIRDVQSGKIHMESNVKEQFEIILGKPVKDRNEVEKFVLSVLDNKGGDIIELGLISAMTELKFSVVERNDSLYNTINSQVPGKFSSPEEMRGRLAEFMLKNPTYIQRIQPAINIINANSNSIRRQTLLMKDRSMKIDDSEIKTKLDGFIKSNNNGLAIGDAIKQLIIWINSNGEEITLLIDVAQRLFPKLISPKASSMAEQSVTFIRTSTILLDKCQKKDTMGIIAELIRTGRIVHTFYKTSKN